MRKPYLLMRESQLLEESYSGAAYIARGPYACTSSEQLFLYLCTVWIECDHITQASDCMEYLLALYSQSTLHGVLYLWQFGRQLFNAWHSVESCNVCFQSDKESLSCRSTWSLALTSSSAREKVVVTLGLNYTIALCDPAIRHPNSNQNRCLPPWYIDSTAAETRCEFTNWQSSKIHLPLTNHVWG